MIGFIFNFQNLILSSPLHRHVHSIPSKCTQNFSQLTPNGNSHRVKLYSNQQSNSESSIMTLNRFILEEAMANADLSHLVDMENLMSSLQLSFKKIQSLIASAGISNLVGLEESNSMNIQGEQQKKLDVLSNEILKSALSFSGKMGIIASEEEDEPVLVDEFYSGNYICVFDPLDGSSNIDAGIATGTIFGIFDENCSCLTSDWQDKIDGMQLKSMFSTMQPGSNLVCSGYCMYSSSTVLVLTFGNGVHAFTLDRDIGEFVLTTRNLKIPEDGKIYSLNESNQLNWDPVIQSYVKSARERGFSSRYIGSMVADVHRTIMYGGMFGYPSDNKNVNGKLRLLYECAPIAFLIEQAGGIATTGRKRILDVIPNAVHQRLPLIIGSKSEVQTIIEMYQEYDKTLKD